MSSAEIDDLCGRFASALRLCGASGKKLEKASERRRALPPGSSRAKVTTANAKWSIAAEAHERNRRALIAIAKELVAAEGGR